MPTAAPMKLSARGGSECTVEVGASAIRDASGESRGAVLVFRDISDRIQTEERLRQAAKLESLGVLAGGIAHDFNNLLMTILGNAELALLDLPARAPARASVARIELAARRASELTGQMLAYAGKGRMVIERFDLNALVEEIHPLVRCRSRKRSSLVYAGPADCRSSPRMQRRSAR